jgi:hypothetical protein
MAAFADSAFITKALKESQGFFDFKIKNFVKIF